MTSTENAAIEVVGLDKVYKDSRSMQVTALDSVNLQVEEGAFVTLFGPSGCGKTTLLRIMAGLEGHTSGKVEIFGESPSANARAKNIAWVPQSSALMPWRTIDGNVELANVVNRKADRAGWTRRQPQPASTILKQIGLGRFTRSMPAQLSGGMQQRASFARGFVHGAPLMLMDEPFSALDEITRISMRHRLLDVWDEHRKTIVFVTHSAFEAVLMSDEIVVMSPRPGRVKKVVHVDLPRPRTVEMESWPRLHALVDEVKGLLEFVEED